jgi:hypothetical protein
LVAVKVPVETASRHLPSSKTWTIEFGAVMKFQSKEELGVIKGFNAFAQIDSSESPMDESTFDPE